MWQAQWVEEQLAAAGVPSRIKVIKTTGDKLSQTALAKLTATKGAKGVFTKEIDDALLKSRVDRGCAQLEGRAHGIESPHGARGHPRAG